MQFVCIAEDSLGNLWILYVHSRIFWTWQRAWKAWCLSQCLLSRLLHWLDSWDGEPAPQSIITLYATYCVRTCMRLIVWPGTIHRTASYWMLIWYKRSINHHSNVTVTHCSYSQVRFAIPAVHLAMYLKNLHVLIITRPWALDAGHCWLYVFNYTGYVMSVSVSAVEWLECIKRILFCMTQTTQCYLAWITYVPLYIYIDYTALYISWALSVLW